MEQPPRYGPEYLQAFGLLEIEWNRLEGELFQLFYQLCGARFDRAHAIFFSLQMHRARREMVEEVALYALANKPSLRKELGSLMRRLRNAAAKRNEIVHTIWEWNGGEPWPFLPSDSGLPLLANILSELRSRTETIIALYGDLVSFRSRVPQRRTLIGRLPTPTRAHRAALEGKRLPKTRVRKRSPPQS
jgi:hypothetical protein